jgi:hypothetical protein
MNVSEHQSKPSQASAVLAIIGGIYEMIVMDISTIITGWPASKPAWVSAVIDVGALLLGLAFLVPWAFIVLPGRLARQHRQEVLS